ncbi:M56 family metallopeptidase [Lysinibacillus macroides]|uniref:Peptidase M56 domain-containing protein n=1 Tax=Lysinibacillus macroides TaxID=33935 RepID=A0A0N0UX53_9BACI|nr:M56 family metallopeptidase [Lysinibacillus macroides]KOY82834.1 hypothetical protein ADM90_05800 [Lysinibacillus macroides]QPR66116.1 M56 family metallopeptidase [Lysinibacillus macroides]
MNEWLNFMITLSVAGSCVSIFAYSITVISREIFTAKWHYRNRKLALSFFLLPFFLIAEVALLFKKDNQLMQLNSLPFIQQNTILLTEAFVQMVFIIWLTGVFITSIWFLFVYQKLYRELRRNCVAVPKEHKVWGILAQLQNDMNVKREINLVYCQANISPFLVGVFKSTIVLPIYAIQNDELTMILKHELIHDKKKDLWMKRAGILARILHWYNPLIYFLQKELTKWCELSCDEDVVLKMSHTERKMYGEMILNMMQRANQQPNSPFSVSLFTKGQMKLKKRLIRILEAQQVSKSIVITAITLFLVFGSVGIVSATFVYKNIQSISENKNMEIQLEYVDIDKREIDKNSSKTISVKLSDKSKFSEEEWSKILKQIENNEVILEEK